MDKLPKLRSPINTKGLSLEERAILLAYDMIYRLKDKVVGMGDEEHDLDANLANLGHIIESKICGGDLALRFEGYDNANDGVGVDAFPSDKSSGEIISEWNQLVDNELNKGFAQKQGEENGSN